jgi:gamma-glutamylputrescine oxidase
MVAAFHEPPSSYWFARAAPPEELDLLIVGAGVVGLSTAWWAARQGLRAVVLEGAGIAAGATGRSNGFLLTGSLQPFTALSRRVGPERAEHLWDLSRENSALVREQLLAGGRLRCGYQAEGSWRTARAGSETELEWRESAELLRRAGFDVAWRSAEEVRERSGSRRLGGALYVASDGALDPVALCRGIAERSGIELRTGVRVRHLEAAGDRVHVAWLGGGALARRVVVAVNAAIGPLVPALAGKVEPLALQGWASAPGERWLSGIWGVAPDGLCLRQLEDGTMLAAGGAGPASPAERGFLEMPTASGQAQLESATHELFPASVEARTLHRWAGTIALTADRLPWVRTIPGLPQVAYAVGFNGLGLSLGFALGRRLAHWLGGDDGALRLFRAAHESDVAPA